MQKKKEEIFDADNFEIASLAELNEGASVESSPDFYEEPAQQFVLPEPQNMGMGGYDYYGTDMNNQYQLFNNVSELNENRQWMYGNQYNRYGNTYLSPYDDQFNTIPLQTSSYPQTIYNDYEYTQQQQQQQQQQQPLIYNQNIYKYGNTMQDQQSPPPPPQSASSTSPYYDTRPNQYYHSFNEIIHTQNVREFIPHNQQQPLTINPIINPTTTPSSTIISPSSARLIQHSSNIISNNIDSSPPPGIIKPLVNTGVEFYPSNITNNNQYYYNDDNDISNIGNNNYIPIINVDNDNNTEISKSDSFKLPKPLKLFDNNNNENNKNISVEKENEIKVEEKEETVKNNENEKKNDDENDEINKTVKESVIKEEKEEVIIIEKEKEPKKEKEKKERKEDKTTPPIDKKPEIKKEKEKSEINKEIDNNNKKYIHSSSRSVSELPSASLSPHLMLLHNNNNNNNNKSQSNSRSPSLSNTSSPITTATTTTSTTTIKSLSNNKTKIPSLLLPGKNNSILDTINRIRSISIFPFLNNCRLHLISFISLILYPILMIFIPILKGLSNTSFDFILTSEKLSFVGVFIITSLYPSLLLLITKSYSIQLYFLYGYLLLLYIKYGRFQYVHYLLMIVYFYVVVMSKELYITYTPFYFRLLLSSILCGDLQGSLSKPKYLLFLSVGCLVNIISIPNVLKCLVLSGLYSAIILLI